MKLDGSKLGVLAGVLTLAAPMTFPPISRADTGGDNPFQLIWKRNSFQLKDPPPPAQPEPPKVEAPSNIELTGISTIFGEKQVYLVLKDAQGKLDPKTFTEGQRQGQVEVLSIDETRGAVRLRNAGVESVLTFEKGGAAIPKGAVPPPMAPPAFGGGIVPPPGFPNPTTFGNPATGQPAFQNLPTPGNANPTGIGSPSGLTDPATGGNTPRVIPQRSVRVPPAPPGAQNTVTPQALTPSTPQLSVEAQTILIEANRMIQQNSSKIEPPFPPTPFTPQ